MHALAGRKVASFGLLVGALVLCSLFTVLGLWQLDRAGQKRTSFEEFESRGVAAKIDLNHINAADSANLSGYRATVNGQYRDTNIILDNQIHQGRAGYLVYTVFEPDGGDQRILVNRGWLRADSERSHSPEFNTPASSQRLEGRLKQPPQTGLRFEGSDLIERMTDNMWRVQVIDFAVLAAELDVELFPITLLLGDDGGDGFVREWTPPGSDEARHLGYAFQWFAMAMTVVVVAAILMLRSGEAGDS